MAVPSAAAAAAVELPTAAAIAVVVAAAAGVPVAAVMHCAITLPKLGPFAALPELEPLTFLRQNWHVQLCAQSVVCQIGW